MDYFFPHRHLSPVGHYGGSGKAEINQYRGLYAAFSFFICIWPLRSVFFPVGWLVLSINFAITAATKKTALKQWLVQPFIQNIGLVLLFLGYLSIFFQYCDSGY